MKIVISEIPEEGIELDLKEEISADPVKIVSPVTAAMKIDKQGSEVIVNGNVGADVELQCSRCLNVFTLKVNSDINVVYRPAEDIGREEHYEIRGDELDTGFYKNDVLDTDDLLKEHVLLNVPMKPLCSEECKGLCPKCGLDLNTAQCNCATSEIDSRLAVLKQLLKKKE